MLPLISCFIILHHSLQYQKHPNWYSLWAFPSPLTRDAINLVQSVSSSVSSPKGGYHWSEIYSAVTCFSVRHQVYTFLENALITHAFKQFMYEILWWAWITWLVFASMEHVLRPSSQSQGSDLSIECTWSVALAFLARKFLRWTICAAAPL